ncbi:MAG: hypothetical protein QNJ47_16150 [Nostocaceae cyanobacterium]|nr:hypothetical protein [Nostocaceae cyanobacterium]
MRNTKLPVVHTSLADNCIRVGSDDWYDWLKKVKAFWYVSQFHTIAVRNGNGNNWYASRRFAGKSRYCYLGKTKDLTYERLQLMAKELSKPDWEYWNQISGTGSSGR